MSVLVRGLVCAGLFLCSAVARAEAAEPVTPAPAKTEQAVRVYMRSDGVPLSFSARERANNGEPTWCVSPCNAEFRPGDYQLKLNGVAADESVSLRKQGTLRGEFHSRNASRNGGWLALNVGGILGGVFITVGALGGPSWAYIAGGGSLAAGGILFVVTYRADSATVTFTPGDPPDVRGMPEPASTSANAAPLDRARFGSSSRGLGFRVAF